MPKGIELDEWDTALLLVTKGWTVKGIERKYAEDTFTYSLKVFSKMIGYDVKQEDGIELWNSFAEKVFTLHNYKMVMQRITRRNIFSSHKTTPAQEIISELSCLKVKDNFILNESLIDR
jgi:hypothetical protein